MRPSGDIQVFSPEEVWALVRTAATEQDGALFLTAAFTGLRMGELLALRWRDVDFAGATIRVRASYAGRERTTPKSGKVRAVSSPRHTDSGVARGPGRFRHSTDPTPESALSLRANRRSRTNTAITKAGRGVLELRAALVFATDARPAASARSPKRSRAVRRPRGESDHATEARARTSLSA